MAAVSAIVGWAHTPFGKLDAPDVESLMTDVVPAALDHAGIGPADIDAITVGVFNNGFARQGFEAALVGAGLPDLAAVPAVRLENACATGSAALHAALDRIESGRARIVLVVGAEKMTAVPTAEASDHLLAASYRREEDAGPAGFAGLFGRIAESYFQRHGDRSRELAQIAAKNHANGLHNPLAHMRKALDADFCATVSERNPRVAGPLKRSDCSLISDGAAALVVADAETAASFPRAIAIRARSQANDALPLSRRDPVAFDGARRAWADAYAAAGITVDDLDLVETHDCFTIAELIEYEAMGLAAPGEGWRVVRDGTAARDGRLPVNLSGGLKAKGHPIGATGVSQHVMAAMQLAGEAGAMQKPGATLAGVFNMGGVAVANYASVLERVR